MPKRTKAPTRNPGKKPPAPSGYFWRAHGAGWDLKKHVVVASHSGESKRREIYVAHLGREAFAEMKKRHRGAALERAIQAWIEDRDQ